MFSHVFVSASHFDRALAFYRALMPVMGIQERFCETERPWAGWQSHPEPRPLFLIGRPFDGEPHRVGNGQMVAFLATSREMVDQAHAVALASGGTSEVAPGREHHLTSARAGSHRRGTWGRNLSTVQQE